jgi:phage tail protein X
MKPSRSSVLGLTLTGLVTVLIASSPKTVKREYLTHTVVRGETVSLICIRHYGRYTDELGQAILRANPDLKDLHTVRAGQKLRLRKPIEPQSREKTVLPPKKAELFERKVHATQGVVTFVEGGARLKRGKAGPTALRANTVVYPGDIIETAGNGRVELIINRESVVRLKANTRMTVEEMRDNTQKKGKTRVRFSLGTLWTRVRSFKDRICRFELELPNAIAGVHGTVYQTQVAADKSADVKVYDGEVEVKKGQRHAGPTAGASGEVSGPHEVPGPHEVTMNECVHIVRSMQRIRIDPNGTAAQPVRFEEQDDEREHFNEERDRHVADIVARL